MPVGTETEWPALPLEAWKDTCETLHLYTQIAGKVRLALAPMEREWAQVALYLNARGLTTSPIPYGSGTFELDFDFIEHEFVLRTGEGVARTIPLVPQSVSVFYRRVMDLLRGAEINVEISAMPQEIPKPIPFAVDTFHASYEPEYARRFWQILVRVDTLFKQHRAAFRGRHSPVHFFWGSFDLAYARFSGRDAKPPPNADAMMRRAMDAEEICAGFWPGDDRFGEPAFYAYAYPKPKGIQDMPVGPRAAFWNPDLGEFILRYSDVIASGSPNAAILEFLDTSYRVCAAKARWAPDLIG
jgi:hypothetical protein